MLAEPTAVSVAVQRLATRLRAQADAGDVPLSAKEALALRLNAQYPRVGVAVPNVTRLVLLGVAERTRRRWRCALNAWQVLLAGSRGLDIKNYVIRLKHPRVRPAAPCANLKGCRRGSRNGACSPTDRPLCALLIRRATNQGRY